LSNAKSAKEALDTFYKYNEYSDKITTAGSLAYIKFTLNTEDEFFAGEKEYYDEIMPMVQNLDLQFKLT
jgi:oligoendopeptidase F